MLQKIKIIELRSLESAFLYQQRLLWIVIKIKMLYGVQVNMDMNVLCLKVFVFV